MSVSFVSLPQVTVATSGTEQRISANAISNAVKVYLSAPAANTGSIWIGDASVAVGRGIEVIKGTTLVLYAENELLDLNNIWVDAATNNDKVSIAYLSKVS